jgi:ribose 5-phosphate isomerase A
MVVVADDRKMVDTLGAFPLPIEITPFGRGTTQRAIAALLGCETSLRMKDDQPLQTDNGNHIVDAHTGATLTNPAATEAALLALAGVVQVGLFIGMCDVVHLAGASGAERLVRPGGRLV